MKAPISEILLAGPRGFCAGVERAIDIVELALSVCKPPVYVRREIVHNRLVVETLRQQGAIFVDELDEVPDDATVIFSAHGISPAVREEGARRGLRVIDATCPLVTKVHLEAVRYAREDYSIVLIGHEDHDEVIGTLGEAPDRIFVIADVDEVATLEVPNPEKVAVSDPDDPLGRRHARRHRGAPPAVPEDRRALAQRHLLRDAESSGRGEAARERRRSLAGDRFEQQLERDPPRGSRADGRHPRLPDQRRRRHPPGVARRTRGASASPPAPRRRRSSSRRRWKRSAGRASRCAKSTWSRKTCGSRCPQELARMAEERGMTLPARTAMRQTI